MQLDLFFAQFLTRLLLICSYFPLLTFFTISGVTGSKLFPKLDRTYESTSASCSSV